MLGRCDRQRSWRAESQLARSRLTCSEQHGCYSRRFLLTVATLPKIIGVVLSSRRVKKGPGRRPQSAKRQRFMELRSRGWSIVAAAREVGVSRSAGSN